MLSLQTAKEDGQAHAVAVLRAVPTDRRGRFPRRRMIMTSPQNLQLHFGRTDRCGGERMALARSKQPVSAPKTISSIEVEGLFGSLITCSRLEKLVRLSVRAM